MLARLRYVKFVVFLVLIDSGMQNVCAVFLDQILFEIKEFKVYEKAPDTYFIFPNWTSVRYQKARHDP